MSSKVLTDVRATVVCAVQIERARSASTHLHQREPAEPKRVPTRGPVESIRPPPHLKGPPKQETEGQSAKAEGLLHLQQV